MISFSFIFYTFFELLFFAIDFSVVKRKWFFLEEPFLFYTRHL